GEGGGRGGGGGSGSPRPLFVHDGSSYTRGARGAHRAGTDGTIRPVRRAPLHSPDFPPAG
ncbi:hypothetical protein, partial [Burkholderia pseudomallei]|uniref:hypothetical protein n=1 Tax=Burkholderia pseudomallei TaxID=28450 RepID=UPI003F671585